MIQRERAQHRARAGLEHFQFSAKKKSGSFFLGFKVSFHLGSQKLDTKKGREKRPLFFICPPPPIFFRAVVSVMGRIKQHFLDQGLTAKDVPLAFACVLFVFFFVVVVFFLSRSPLSRKESARSYDCNVRGSF